MLDVIPTSKIKVKMKLKFFLSLRFPNTSIHHLKVFLIHLSIHHPSKTSYSLKYHAREKTNSIQMTRQNILSSAFAGIRNPHGYFNTQNWNLTICNCQVGCEVVSIIIKLLLWVACRCLHHSSKVKATTNWKIKTRMKWIYMLRMCYLRQIVVLQVLWIVINVYVIVQNVIS